MKIPEDVRQYAEQAISDEEALAKGMAEPSAANRSVSEIAEGKSTMRSMAREGEAQRSQKSKEFVEKARRFTRRRECAITAA